MPAVETVYGVTVEIGCCVSSLDQVAAVEAAGGDYYDLPVARTVMADGEPAFAALLGRAAGFRLKPRAYNVFLPADLPVSGPAVDGSRVDTYLRTAFDRVGRLGGPIIGFGSGRSRSVPDGFPRPAALDQLEGFLRRAAAMATAYGITLAIEPLRRAESNVFNTLRECAGFIRQRRLDGIRLVADCYHMMEEEEPLDALDASADLLAHVQVADRGRRPPGLGAYDLSGFLQRLRRLGYRGDCSIECTWTDFSQQIAPALQHLRGAARAAGWWHG